MKKNYKIKTNTKLSFFQAILWISLITLFTSGSAFAALIYFKYKDKLKQNDANYNIEAIVQSCSTRENIKCVYLAEMLNLSVDHPINIHAFDVQKANEYLHSYFIFKNFVIKKLSPGALFINYQIREPVAFLGNFSNSAFDENGKLFPFKPFFHPKKIPTIYLDEALCENLLWGSKIDSRFITIFKNIYYQVCMIDKVFIERIDLSKIDAENSAKKEIILTLAMKSFSQPLYLRLNANNYLSGLSHFKKIAHFLKGDESILDLRLNSLIFIKKK